MSNKKSESLIKQYRLSSYNGYYLNSVGTLINDENAPYILDLYQITNPNLRYVLKGSTQGAITVLAFYSGYPLTEDNKISTYYSQSSNSLIVLDTEIAMPSTTKYIAITRSKAIAEDEAVALFTTAGANKIFELPIISVTLRDENKNEYGALVQNWYASWSYLIKFYQYDLPAYRGDCNTLGDIYANDIKKSMKHVIEFYAEEDLNEMQLIKTSIGNGKIEDVSVNLNTRLAKVTLMYKPK